MCFYTRVPAGKHVVRPAHQGTITCNKVPHIPGNKQRHEGAQNGRDEMVEKKNNIFLNKLYKIDSCIALVLLTSNLLLLMMSKHVIYVGKDKQTFLVDLATGRNPF